jgi:hypothetical protein
MYQILLFVGIAILYAVLKVYLEKRLAPLDVGSEDYQLSSVAFETGSSAYELFTRAGETWEIPAEKINDDFKSYLKKGILPHYVRAYLRGHYHADHTYHELIFSGGRPPYL